MERPYLIPAVSSEESINSHSKCESSSEEKGSFSCSFQLWVDQCISKKLEYPYFTLTLECCSYSNNLSWIVMAYSWKHEIKSQNIRKMQLHKQLSSNSMSVYGQTLRNRAEFKAPQTIISSLWFLLVAREDACCPVKHSGVAVMEADKRNACYDWF